MDILVASFNAHKLEELGSLFPGHRLLSPADLGIAEFHIEEDGADYCQNALIKAKALHARAGLPTLADDSGLSVRALDGAPGVRSARYGSKDGLAKLSAAERNSLLLAEMRGVEDRACAFYCCLVLLGGGDSFLAVQETCPGLLAHEPRGSGGFGYDPIVFLPQLGKTVAELAPDAKALISHRGKAARAMRLALEALDRAGS